MPQRIQPFAGAFFVEILLSCFESLDEDTVFGYNLTLLDKERGGDHVATQEEIEELLSMMHEVKPHASYQESMRRMDKSLVGIGGMLRYLAQVNEPVTAGQISKGIHVSTARVAVMLKKMEAKGLIVRERDAKDARITMVRLSEQGSAVAEKMRVETYAQIGQLIDCIGMARMMEFIDVAKEILALLKKPVEAVLEEEVKDD